MYDDINLYLLTIYNLNYHADFEILCRSMRMILTIIGIADVAVGHHLSQASVEPFFATR
jgi:hypothetical protein